MNVIYTNYAEDTIKDRNLSKTTIEEALFNPDNIVDGKKGRKIAHKIVNNKLLRIIYETKEKAYIVVTAYYTSPERYKNENKF